MKDGHDKQDDIPALIGVRFGEGQDIDGIFDATARRLRTLGLTVAGLVQIRGEADEDCACREMHLRDLASGELHRISEERGSEARGCHLDWQALLTLAQATEDALTPETSLLIINRFGRSESEGKGMRSVIEKAMLMGVPVMVAFREQYAAQWAEFHGGLATGCRPHVDTLVDAVVQRACVKAGGI